MNRAQVACPIWFMLNIDDLCGCRDFTVGVSDTNQYFILDLGARTTVSKLLLNSTGSPGDYPRSYIIFVSDDGKDFGSDSVLSGKGDSSLVTIAFPAPVTTRFIKIVQVRSGLSDEQVCRRCINTR